LSRSILLVEDNPIDLDLAKRAFSRRKIANPIQVAHDGAEALTWLQRWEEGEQTPAVILLDLNLPKLHGLEVLRRLKEHSRFHAIPVVMFSTSNEHRDIETAYQLGANSYIVKPVNFERFLEVADRIELYWIALNEPPCCQYETGVEVT
jgi:CheY-like chemotaxis protein